MPRQQISANTLRKFSMLALVISAVVVIAVLGTRNLYDDEILSLPIITSGPQAIVHFAAASDVHPPGMYLLAHLAYRVIPSFRWMNLIPTAVLYVGLSMFLLSFAPLFRQPLAQAIFLLLATLHPQLLLWGTSYRWYSWWTGIALVTIVAALQPSRGDASLSIRRCISIGLLLATLLYINYITLLFAPALAVAAALRYRPLTVRRKLTAALVVSAVFMAMSAPQLDTLFTSQLRRSASQRSGAMSSFAHLAQATLSSEAYLPWHPLALVCAAMLLLALGIGVMSKTTRGAQAQSNRPLSGVTAFALCFFLLVGISGLGGRPRNALLLIPMFGAVLARASERLPLRLQQAAVVVIALWSAVGISHMLSRTRLPKGTMIDRPEQVIAYMRSTQSQCAIVVTYDPLLAFSVSHPRRSGVLLLSPFTTPITQSEPLPPGCGEPHLYIVRSYIGGNGRWADRINSELDSAALAINRPAQHAMFSFDPDAARKRTLSRILGFGDLDSAARLPDYRYVVAAGPILASSLPQLRTRLPDFCTPDECLSPVSRNP